jgi:hypothetical protein
VAGNARKYAFGLNQIDINHDNPHYFS